jgi:hypothetical protein
MTQADRGATLKQPLDFRAVLRSRREALHIYVPSPRAAVAQLDRAPGYEPGGRGFESLRPRQTFRVRSQDFGNTLAEDFFAKSRS